ncbi:nuclear transport factor 2 family protein [Natrinema sp. 1APR25-10V2]|uniref:nuclear transport factor 2 family protein n=1 Tax=Natrinema sp. 1APR25-10V2 TaxID=2951081 RepID=UPI0028750799|nr:nuclear transport factor 2 family protein [Natrinema sp. 1APR25-10V2]MDS0476854.1 nuclear transport factor 2 family protein [Natrinema sp. 1APR25-10V2]
MAATEKTNVEIAEELYEAFNRGDIETCLAGFADDITWTEPEESPMIGGTHHGPDAVLEEVFTPLDETFDTFEVAVDRFIDGGDTVVMEGAHRVTTADGDVMEIPAVHVSDMEDGKVTKFTGYEDTALAQQLMDE